MEVHQSKIEINGGPYVQKWSRNIGLMIHWLMKIMKDHGPVKEKKIW